jgi:hypothetical protein
MRGGLAAMSLCLALAGNSIAGTLTLIASTETTSLQSIAKFAACQAEWCGGKAPAGGSSHSLALTNVARFETPIQWQSSFSIAGSRVWSKFIKFSRTGINVRLPLN